VKRWPATREGDRARVAAWNRGDPDAIAAARRDDEARRSMKCWMCGVEPTGLAEITALNEVMPRFLPTGWPPGDHEHAVQPPTPGELEQAGHEALMRIRQAAT
jgi:hypothetical protein